MPVIPVHVHVSVPSRPTSPGSTGDQFADQKDYLLREFACHAGLAHSRVDLVTEFLDQAPYILRLLQTKGEQDAQSSESYIPACFTERINRLIGVVVLLRTNLRETTINAEEAALIFEQTHMHLHRLTFSTDKCGHPTVGADYIALRITEVYRPSIREDGYAGLLRSEPYLLWKLLESTGRDCATCQDTNGPSARFQVGQFAHFRKDPVTELFIQAQNLDEDPCDQQHIIDFLRSFKNRLRILTELGQDEAEFSRSDAPRCFRGRCAKLGRQTRKLRGHL